MYLAYQNAVKIVNTYFDGVDGHPLELVKCNYGASAQQGQECGDQFANDKAVKAVLWNGGNLGASELTTANNKSKPYFCTLGGPGYSNIPDLFCMNGGALSLGDVLTYLKDLKITTVSFVSEANPVNEAIVDGIKSEYAAAGITVTTAFNAPGSTDLTSTVVAAGSQSTGATAAIITAPGDCLAYASAFKSLGINKPIISLPNCITGSTTPAGWTFLEQGPSPYVADPTGELAVYKAADAAYHTPTGTSDSEQAFGTALLLARILNKVGSKNLTPTAIEAKIKAYTGPLFLGALHLAFGAQPFPSIGSTAAAFYTFKGGKWSPAIKGAWVG
jgi:branched-chain amino acid transport system substrate-binding protein